MAIAPQAFQWGSAGRKLTTPEQAARQRLVAEALMASGTTPAANWAQGLADVTGALAGSKLNNEALAAEEAGGIEAGGLFGGLTSESPQADIMAALNHPWLNDNQSAVARSLLGDQLKAADAGADLPANIREWEYFNQLTPEEQAQYLVMKRSNPYLDIGTGFVQPNPVAPGTANGPEIVKDNFTPAYDSAEGTATAKADVETKVAFDSLNSKLPGLKSVVAELGDLADKATYTTAGKLWDEVVRETGNLPTEGAQARTKYMSMVDNQVLPLLRDTFGAAFTVSEGESLRATLGAPDKTPAEKKAVLEAFIEQKVRDLEALQSRVSGSGIAPAAVVAPVAPVPTPSGGLETDGPGGKWGVEVLD